MSRSTSAISALPAAMSESSSATTSRTFSRSCSSRPLARSQAGEGALDPRQGALGAVEGIVQGLRRSCSIAKRNETEGQAVDRRLTPTALTDNRHQPIGQPESGAPADPRWRSDAADPTPTCQCHSRAGDGCGRSRQFGPSRHADGHGRRRHGAVHAAPEVRLRRPALARPRPLRPVGRPWLDADLCAAASDRLCAADDRGHPELPPALQPLRRPSREFHACRGSRRPPARSARGSPPRSEWPSPSGI